MTLLEELKAHRLDYGHHSCPIPISHANFDKLITAIEERDELKAEAQALRDDAERLRGQVIELDKRPTTQFFSDAINGNLDLQNMLDMQRDEFLRIAACQNAPSEIKALCERAASDIRSKICLIDQREKVADENMRLHEALSQIEASHNILSTQSSAKQSQLESYWTRIQETEQKLTAAEKRAEDLVQSGWTSPDETEKLKAEIELRDRAIERREENLRILGKSLSNRHAEIAELKQQIHRLSPPLTPIFTHDPDTALSLPEETTEDKL